jgi:positive regulator of sigma E activity
MILKEKCAVLKKLHGDLYEIKIIGDSAHCAACSFQKNCSNQNQVMIARSPINHEPGEEVFVEIPEKDETFRALFIFLIPLLAGLLGAILSYEWFFPENNGFAALFFFIFLLSTIVFLKTAEKKVYRRLPVILEKENGENTEIKIP